MFPPTSAKGGTVRYFLVFYHVNERELSTRQAVQAHVVTVLRAASVVSAPSDAREKRRSVQVESVRVQASISSQRIGWVPIQCGQGGPFLPP